MKVVPRGYKTLCGHHPPTPAVICVYCFTRGSLGWAQPSWEHLCYNPALNTISSPGIVVEMV